MYVCIYILYIILLPKAWDTPYRYSCSFAHTLAWMMIVFGLQWASTLGILSVSDRVEESGLHDMAWHVSQIREVN